MIHAKREMENTLRPQCLRCLQMTLLQVEQEGISLFLERREMLGPNKGHGWARRGWVH